MAIPQIIQQAIENTLALKIKTSQTLSGGCIHNAQKVITNKGTFFVKYNEAYQAHNFQVEAQGLSLLESSKVVTVPKVIHTETSGNYAWLVLEFIEQSNPASNYWEVFGKELASLHLHSQGKFGLDHSNYIGKLPQKNEPHSTWIDFFIEERIRPMVKMAVDKREIEQSTANDFELLFTKLESYFPEEPPALIHGDLWGGNILRSEKGHPVLIDPAVYYGHREIELAFMTLFDSQPASFYEAYQSIYPLESEFRSRFDLYNLYPLLVHVNLFGGGYANSVKQILRRYI